MLLTSLKENSLLLGLLCAWGLGAVLAKHPGSSFEAQQDAAAFMSLMRSEVLQGRANPILGNAMAQIDYASHGYKGFRGVFQWMAGLDEVNEGIFNFLQFFTDEAGGYIGLQNYYSSSTFKLIFSVWDALDAFPGDDVECSNFGGEGVGWKCYIENFQLERNGIYYLDVEINGRNLTGYISEPQKDLSSFSDANIRRHRIGHIIMPDIQNNLIPFAYYNENFKDQPSCKLAYELVTVNCAPQQYVHFNGLRESSSLKEAHTYNSKCSVENILVSLTSDKQCTIYFTRPTA